MMNITCILGNLYFILYIDEIINGANNIKPSCFHWLDKHSVYCSQSDTLGDSRIAALRAKHDIAGVDIYWYFTHSGGRQYD